MYCKHCGGQIDDDSIFCAICGEGLKGTSNIDSHSANSYVKSVFSADITDKRNNPNEICCPKCGSNRIQPESATPVIANKRWQCLSCGNIFRTLQDAKTELNFYRNKSPLTILWCSIAILFFAFIFDAFDFSHRDGDFLANLHVICYIVAAFTFIAFIASCFMKNEVITNLEEEVRKLDVKNNDVLKSFVTYSTPLPTINDCESLIVKSGLKSLLSGVCQDEHIYTQFHDAICSRFNEMIATSILNKSRNFICKKDGVSIEVELVYGDGALKCEIRQRK